MADLDLSTLNSLAMDYMEKSIKTGQVAVESTEAMAKADAAKAVQEQAIMSKQMEGLERIRQAQLRKAEIAGNPPIFNQVKTLLGSDRHSEAMIDARIQAELTEQEKIATELKLAASIHGMTRQDAENRLKAAQIQAGVAQTSLEVGERIQDRKFRIEQMAMQRERFGLDKQIHGFQVRRYADEQLANSAMNQPTEVLKTWMADPSKAPAALQGGKFGLIENAFYSKTQQQNSHVIQSMAVNEQLRQRQLASIPDLDSIKPDAQGNMPNGMTVRDIELEKVRRVAESTTAKSAALARTSKDMEYISTIHKQYAEVIPLPSLDAAVKKAVSAGHSQVEIGDELVDLGTAMEVLNTRTISLENQMAKKVEIGTRAESAQVDAVVVTQGLRTLAEASGRRLPSNMAEAGLPSLISSLPRPHQEAFARNPQGMHLMNAVVTGQRPPKGFSAELGFSQYDKLKADINAANETYFKSLPKHTAQASREFYQNGVVSTESSVPALLETAGNPNAVQTPWMAKVWEPVSKDLLKIKDGVKMTSMDQGDNFSIESGKVRKQAEVAAAFNNKAAIQEGIVEASMTAAARTIFSIVAQDRAAGTVSPFEKLINSSGTNIAGKYIAGEAFRPRELVADLERMSNEAQSAGILKPGESYTKRFIESMQGQADALREDFRPKNALEAAILNYVQDPTAQVIRSWDEHVKLAPQYAANIKTHEDKRAENTSELAARAKALNPGKPLWQVNQ